MAKTTTTTYDFVIVGGGASGLVIASRLSEDPEVKVLVLEAGKNLLADPMVATPAGWASFLGSDADWNFETTAQVSTHALGWKCKSYY
jgi:choline dehydrogenase-like flavoprotein